MPAAREGEQGGRRQRRRAGGGQPDAGERPRQAGLGRPSGTYMAGTAGTCGDPVPGDQLQRPGRVEVVDQHAGRAGPGQQPEPRVQPVRVEERDGQQHHVAGQHRGRPERGALLQVGQQRPVGEHRAARPPAGAAGVAEHGQVLGRARHVPVRQLGRVGEQARQRQRAVRPGRRRDQHVPQLAGPQRGGLGDHVHRRGDQRPGAGVRQQVGQLGPGVAGVGRHRDQPGPQRAEVERREVDRVAQLEHDPVAGGEAEPAQRARPPGRPARPARPRSASPAPDSSAGWSPARSAARVTRSATVCTGAAGSSTGGVWHSSTPVHQAPVGRRPRLGG